jgi:hypothetical protein
VGLPGSDLPCTLHEVVCNGHKRKNAYIKRNIKVLVKVTQVSDVARGPLVLLINAYIIESGSSFYFYFLRREYMVLYQWWIQFKIFILDEQVCNFHSFIGHYQIVYAYTVKEQTLFNVRKDALLNI